jgi:hypothetical protein
LVEAGTGLPDQRSALEMNRFTNHRGRWTPEEDAQLIELFAQGCVLKEVSAALQRSQEAVRTRANVLRIAVTSGPRRRMQRSA